MLNSRSAFQSVSLLQDLETEPQKSFVAKTADVLVFAEIQLEAVCKSGRSNQIREAKFLFDSGYSSWMFFT